MSRFPSIRSNNRLARVVILNLLLIALRGSAPSAALAQIEVLTARYDPARIRVNLKETRLAPPNAQPGSFGELYTYPVDSAGNAQPLYLTGVTIEECLRNVLYVASINDKVCASSADSASPTPLWMRNWTNTPLIVATSNNIFGNVGIGSIPVIYARRAPGGQQNYIVILSENDGRR